MDETTQKTDEQAVPSVESTHENESGQGAQPGAPVLPKIINFDTLARCGEEVWIENGGQIYRLRRTRAGKLILTK